MPETPSTDDETQAAALRAEIRRLSRLVEDWKEQHNLDMVLNTSLIVERNKANVEAARAKAEIGDLVLVAAQMREHRRHLQSYREDGRSVPYCDSETGAIVAELETVTCVECLRQAASESVVFRKFEQEKKSPTFTALDRVQKLENLIAAHVENLEGLVKSLEKEVGISK